MLEHRLVAALPRPITKQGDHVLAGSHKRAAKALKEAIAALEHAAADDTLSAGFRAECAAKASLLVSLPRATTPSGWTLCTQCSTSLKSRARFLITLTICVICNVQWPRRGGTSDFFLFKCRFLLTDGHCIPARGQFNFELGLELESGVSNVKVT